MVLTDCLEGNIIIRLLLLIVEFITLTAPTAGMQIDIQESIVVMSGDVTGNECSQLRVILQQNRLSTVILTQSKGGNANAGYCVGELIRKYGLATVIRGSCNSSCSRMWLGGVSRSLTGSNSRVGLHGNYRDGDLRPEAPGRLQAWIPSFAPSVNKKLMEQWTSLPTNKHMMFFYNDRAELCVHGECMPLPGWNALNAGLSTQ